MSMYIQTISEAFAKFAGKALLNPERMTCDVDTVLEDLRTEAAEVYGLDVHVEFPGKNAPDMRDDRLLVAVKKEGSVYKIADFKIG
jgi:hypothetical protein